MLFSSSSCRFLILGADTHLISLFLGLDTHLISLFLGADTHLISLFLGADTHLISLFLGADTHLISLFSHTLNPCVLHLRETTLPRKVTRKVALLCKLILMFSDRERETKDSERNREWETKDSELNRERKTKGSERNSGKPSPKWIDSYFLFLLCLDFTVPIRYLNFVLFLHDLLSIKINKLEKI